mgnify:CR=1 FL=1
MTSRANEIRRYLTKMRESGALSNSNMDAYSDLIEELAQEEYYVKSNNSIGYDDSFPSYHHNDLYNYRVTVSDNSTGIINNNQYYHGVKYNISHISPNPWGVAPVIKPDPATEAEEADSFIKEYFNKVDEHGLYKEETILSTISSNQNNTGADTNYLTEKCFSRDYADGSKVFWIKRKHTTDIKKHNLHGPAVIYDDKIVEYWINGKRFNETNFNLIQNSLILK